MNPLSFVFQVALGFSVGCLLLRPDSFLPRNQKMTWPLEVPLVNDENDMKEERRKSNIVVGSGNGIPSIRRRGTRWGTPSAATVMQHSPGANRQTKHAAAFLSPLGWRAMQDY